MVAPEGAPHSQPKEVLQDEYEPAWFVKKVARSPAGRRENPAGRPEKPDVFSAFRADLKGYVRLNPLSWRIHMSNATQRRELLSNDCAKAFALAVDPNLYHLSVKLQKPKLRMNAARTNPSISTKG